mmetsp:Transcript_75587/g.173021  ORF Transcript_75587/g.173021 Transcript_75587/m.173021 type:complete len:92 (-) Transcript_75587:114-389(-)
MASPEVDDGGMVDYQSHLVGWYQIPAAAVPAFESTGSRLRCGGHRKRSSAPMDTWSEGNSTEGRAVWARASSSVGMGKGRTTSSVAVSTKR